MPNPYLLAADNDPALLPFLRENPALASGQDEHGYSLIHAAASYNHLDLLRSLVTELNVPVDLRDEDGETALFVTETVEAARVLVEELHLDANIKNDEGQTAREKIEADEEFPAVAEYLARVTGGPGGVNGVSATNGDAELPPAPEGLRVTVGTMSAADEATQEPDPEFRRRIEELAAREDFDTPERQAELRQLIQDAVSGEGFSDERNVRARQD
ncbi:ankyrin repeat-containing protein [Thozetella sp. PMI_491]|nr:ankyrin repeat-containing protein [Thozetella sp. PMI_491]